MCSPRSVLRLINALRLRNLKKVSTLTWTMSCLIAPEAFDCSPALAFLDLMIFSLKLTLMAPEKLKRENFEFFLTFLRWKSFFEIVQSFASFVELLPVFQDMEFAQKSLLKLFESIQDLSESIQELIESSQEFLKAFRSFLKASRSVLKAFHCMV